MWIQLSLLAVLKYHFVGWGDATAIEELSIKIYSLG
jgi:hypothetical protein